MLSYSPHVNFPTSSDVSIGNIVPTDTEETRIDIRKEKVREQLVTWVYWSHTTQVGLLQVLGLKGILLYTTA
jgi:hypothetical protein